MTNKYDYNNTRQVSTREPSSGLFSSPLPFALALLGGGAVIFCLWFFFYAGTNSASNQPIPIIKAEAGPMKVRPDNASQPEVPHQDKLVYSRVNPAEQGAGVERLLPPTEEPMDRAEPEVTQVAQAADDGFPSSKAAAENRSEFRTESPASNVETTYQKAEPTKETTLSVEQLAGVTMTPKHKSEAKKEEVASEERVAEPTHNLAATAKAPAKKESAASKTLQTGYRIQLASMKSQDQAKQEWVRLQGEFKGALGGLSPNFTRVDLGAKKGVFFRVHAGDFSSKGEAQNVCNKMKSQNPSAGCFIVKF